MATKQAELEMMARGEGVLGKAPPDEPIFILRAQDSLAADMVEKWIIHARAAGCSKKKILDAMNIVEEMRRWPTRKNPD
jgi:hypothetical protein